MKYLIILSACVFFKQTCGNSLIIINTDTESIYVCNTVTLECNLTNAASLILLRETNSCSKMVQTDPIFNKSCGR
jgi:hypothetical protein